MSSRPRNAFLRGLDEGSYALLQSHLKPVDLALGITLVDPGETVTTVYFPEGALISLLSNTADGETVETAMAGSEGASGLLEACGSGESSVTSLVQVDGRAWAMPARAARELMQHDEDFARRAWRAVEFQLGEARQSGMCQALHPVENRLARWLLESSERAAGRNPMPLTQEFIASMLGVQRTTVTSYAAQLQKSGLIRYARGRLEIVDAQGLENKACECRGVMRRQRERLGFVPMEAAAQGGPTLATSGGVRQGSGGGEC